MLVRRSTLTLVVVAAGVFFLGSSFVVYKRPDYIPSNVLPEKWRDWSGLGSDSTDAPLPVADSSDTHSGPGVSNPAAPHPPSPPVYKPAPPSPNSGDDDLHILPISPGEIEVKPLPVSSENTHRRPIEISSPALKERLVALLGAPLPTYPQSVKESSKSCPAEIADRQVNPDQHAGNLEKWLSMETDELASRRLAIVQYLEGLDKEKKDFVGWK